MVLLSRLSLFDWPFAGAHQPFRRGSLPAPKRLLVAALTLVLILCPTQRLSAASLEDLKLTPEESKRIADYARRCEQDRAVLEIMNQHLTQCEFDRDCPSGESSFLFGLLVGAAAIFVVDRL